MSDRAVSKVYRGEDLKSKDTYENFNISAFAKALTAESESYWIASGEKRALKVFHMTADRVPAYKDFLKKSKISPGKIKTIADFQNVPILNKKNYIHAYSLKERCLDGDFRHAKIIASSSGTKGEPAFWPRGGLQEFESGIIHELMYKYLFLADKLKTLIVICFPMGVYVSGIATVLPTWLVSTKYANVSSVTAGNNKAEVLRTIKHLAPDFEQIVLVGHPFFIKDVIETGPEHGISWAKCKLKLFFCSGSFNESWRQYIAKKAGINSGLVNIINTYGSAEFLLMANETPVSIFARSLMESNASGMVDILPRKESIPGLFQFNPLLRFIESVNGELIFTVNSGTPLVRFNLHDEGDVIPFDEVAKRLDRAAPNWRDNVSGKDSKYPIWSLPFVTLYGRSDYTVKFHAVNIYPEHIQAALNEKRFIRKLSGKFVMTKGYLKNMEEYLDINIELSKGTVTATGLSGEILQTVVTKLKEINREYLDASNHLGKKLIPRVKLWPYQHSKYFKAGLKPKYIGEV